MMSESLNHHTVFESISQDHDLCEQMLAKLQIEKFALENSDMNLLEQTIAEKAQILEKLANIQNMRDQALETLGFDIGFRGLKAMFAQDNMLSNEHLELIKKLENLLTKISEISQVNSVLVYNSFNQNNKILDIMLDRNNHQTTYNKNGFTNMGMQENFRTTKV